MLEKKGDNPIMNEKTLQYRLINSLEQFTNNTAIECGEQVMSYHELHRQSNYIAHWIIDKGYKKESFIGIFMDDTLQLITAIIGILKAGCVFMPLDPAHPVDRLEVMIASTGTRLILLDQIQREGLETSEILQRTQSDDAVVNDLIANAPEDHQWFSTTPAIEYEPNDKIYIYFTSGSTGIPKPMLGRNKGLNNCILWELERFDIHQDFRFSQLINPGFDAFLRDVFAPLFAGATICIPAFKETILDPQLLVQWVERENINLIHCTPSVFRHLNVPFLSEKYFQDLKYILLSGEPIEPACLIPWYELIGDGVQLVNLWGTSEATLIQTAYFIQPADAKKERVPVGLPIKGVRIIVLDSDMKVCDEGRVGEVYVRTPFRTHGYWNNPEANEARFLQNPFNPKPGDLIHRTGDLGKILPDGNLDIVGRVDRQIKLRGIRIELEGIESVLTSHPRVREAAVIKKTPSQDQELLCAFVTGDWETVQLPERDALQTGIKEFLNTKFPAYMIPARIVFLEIMPRNANRKIDFNQLSDLFDKMDAEYIPPTNKMERTLSQLWAQELRLKKVGVTNHFFELGGNSLNLMTLITRIHKTFDIRVTLADMFANSTVRSQAAFIRGSQKNRYISIEPAPQQEFYPLSSSQKRLFVLAQIDKQSIAYNIFEMAPLTTEISLPQVEKAVRELVRRHESLRTSFEIISAQAVQKIHEDVPVPVQFYPDPGTPVEDIVDQFIQPFDLARVPLLRVGLIHGNGKEHILLIDMHHIISDGVSHALLVDEFVALCRDEQLPELRLQYKDFAQWQQQKEQQAQLKEQENFWLEQFSDNIPILNLPTDYSRPQTQQFGGAVELFVLDEETTSKLKQLAVAEDATLFHIILAAFNIMLSKVSGQQDIVIGTGVSGRGHADLWKIVGFFVNTLALRNFPTNDKSFRHFLAEVKGQTLDAMDNQDYPFEDLVEKVNVNRDTSRNPLFDVMFVMENIGTPGQAGSVDPGSIQQDPLESYRFRRRMSKFDYSIFAIEMGNQVTFLVEYGIALFKKETVLLFNRYLQETLRAVADNAALTLAQLKAMPLSRQTQALQQLHRSQRPESASIDPRHTIQQHLFSTLSDAQRGAFMAIQCGDREITYETLQHLTNTIANHLSREQGIVPGTFVGIFLDDRADIVISILALLKVRAVFVPLDTAYPDARLESMIGSVGIKHIISSQTIHDNRLNALKQDSPALQWLMFDTLSVPHPDFETAVPGFTYQPDDAVYIYFTSGTTGTPNAIKGKNISLLHFIDWEIKTFNIDDSCRVSQLITPGFDAFLRDMLVPLCSGGTLCIPENRETLLDAPALIRWIDENRITLIHCVPGLFRTFDLKYLEPHLFKHLKYLTMSGEKINPSDLKDWYATYGSRIQLVNFCGSSETTMAKSYYLIQPQDVNCERVPIGKPITATALYILNDQMKVCDTFVTGEIYIATPYRTFGYHDDSALNDKWFILHPITGAPAVLMHRTGDLGRYLADGNVDILGRNDRQVKIRGQRVELEEIENFLAKHPAVADVAVTKKVLAGNNELLCAYITVNPGAHSHDDNWELDIHRYLSGKLPGYMIPGNIMMLPEIPRTPVGKVAYAQLPNPIEETQDTVVAADTPHERRLLKLWVEVLKITHENISITRNFFELGGNSLNLMALIAKIHMVFNVRLSLADMFNNLNIQQQAQLLLRMKEARYDSIEPAPIQEFYPLSSAQKRLYILAQIDKESVAYNIFEMAPLASEISREQVEKAVQQLVRRHESLRTSFEMVAGEMVQKIHDTVSVPIAFFQDPETPVEDIVDQFIQPFDLAQVPLVRAGLIQRSGKEHILLIDMHHIISDGVSHFLLVNQFIALCRQEELPELRLQYKDFALWQQQEEQQAQLKEQETFWLEQFSDNIPILNLPGDYSRPLIQQFDGATELFVLNEETTAKLNQLALSRDATLFMVILAAFNIMLSKVTGQHDIVIGTGVSGRRHTELWKIVGFFVNTLALRNFPSNDKSFLSFLAEVKTRSLEAMDNQDYPFEDLVEKVGIKRDTSRNPLFDVMFVMENMGTPGEANRIDPGAIQQDPLESYRFRRRMSKFDCTIFAMEEGNHVKFLVEYSTSLFKKETLRLFNRYLQETLCAVADNAELTLAQLKEIPASRQHDVLHQLHQSQRPESATTDPRHTIQQRLADTLADARRGAAVAIQCGNREITYDTFQRLTNTAGNYLIKEHSIAPGTFVGICLDDRADIIIAVIALLKARAVFVPLDPAFPDARLESMISTVGISHIISSQTIYDNRLEELKQSQNPPTWINFDSLTAPNSQLETNPPQIDYQPDDAVYIYFTSGTTGTPNAIKGKNVSLLHFIEWEIETFNIDDRCRVSQLITPGFDAFLRDMLVPLCSGGTLCIPENRETILDAPALIRWIDENRIALIHCVPGLFRTFDVKYLEPRLFKHLKYLTMSGEKINPSDLEGWYDTFGARIQLVNFCGSSETTMSKSCYFIQPGDVNRQRVPIGKPITATAIYILDDRMKLCDTFVTGEIYIATPYSTFGYHNNSALNDKLFIAHAITGESPVLMHRTGDLGRYLADGNIDILGRNDRQVKIRGMRIELEEIERFLVKHPGIHEVAVIKKVLSNEKELLCAYISVNPDATSNEDNLELDVRRYLSAKLPDYMIPAGIVILPEIPRTPVGKVDYAGLLDSNEEAQKTFIAPANSREQRILHLWGEVLKMSPEHIGVTHNFFELGGNSLNLVALISRVHAALDVQLSMSEMFNINTIRGQAQLVAQKDGAGMEILEPAPNLDYYPLSSVQQRLYFTQLREPESTAYNMVQVIVLEEKPNLEQMEKAFHKLIQRHESLRTSFVLDNDKPAQQISQTVDFKLETFAVADVDPLTGRNEEYEKVLADFVRPFDLTRPPLFRVGIVDVTQQRTIIIYDMHHIISDGASQKIFESDFVNFYLGRDLEPLTLQYKDYAYFQHQGSGSDNIKAHEEYWLSQFKETPPLLDLPLEIPRSQMRTSAGHVIDSQIGSEQLVALRQLANQENVTLFMVILSIYYIFLSKLSNQEDVVIGVPIAGRVHIDIEPVIGMFANTVALRTSPRSGLTFSQFLQHVRTASLDAFNNQDYPFEDLIAKLGLQRQIQRNPLFDVVFTFLNFGQQTRAVAVNEEDTVDAREIYARDTRIAKFDLALIGQENQDNLTISLEYRTEFFAKEIAHRFINYFKEIMAAVLADPGTLLADINLDYQLADAQSEKMIADFQF
jgi:tyrocidine synthetase III